MTPATCVCGKTRGEKNPDNHTNVVTDEAVAATCTTTGLTEGSHCEDCKAMIVAQTEVAVDLNNHAFATSLSHNETHHWYACTREGCNEKAYEDPHTWNDGVVTTNPTETEKGVKTYTCTAGGCGATKTEDIDPTGTTIEPECKHETTQAIDNGDETHRIVCATEGCDHVVKESEPHAFDGDGVCICGAKKPVYPEHMVGFSVTALYDTYKNAITGQFVFDEAKESIGADKYDQLGITVPALVDGWAQVDMTDSDEVTLLFKIYVQGKMPGMNYKVVSDGSVWVGGDPMEGTIPNRVTGSSGEVGASIYVTRTYTRDDVISNQWGNWFDISATVTPGVFLNVETGDKNEAHTTFWDSVRVILPTVYTVTYTDGVEGSEIFADQTIKAVEGAATPAFVGTPTRSGYTFTGWSPAVAETVTKDVTYVAQWSSNYVPPQTTYYTLTINYVDAEGNTVAETVTRRLAEGSTYTVASPAVEGMTPDQETVTGTLNRSLTVTVTYNPVEDVETTIPSLTETPEPTESTEPTETEEPGETEDLGENDTPLIGTPDETEDPNAGEESGETEELGENDTPLANVPQTGDMLWLWIVLALSSAAGLVWISLEEKKGKRVA